MKNLSFQEKFDLFVIEDSIFVNSIIKMYWKFKKTGENSFGKLNNSQKEL